MKLWKVNILRAFIVIISIIVLSLLIYWLPGLADSYEVMAPEFSYMKLPLLLGVYLTGLPFFIAIFNTFKLLKLIEKNAVFSMKSLDYLATISKCSISEILIYCLGIAYLYINNAMQAGIILSMLLIIFTAFVIYVFTEVLKELLLKVVEIKTENEFTI